MSEQMLYYVSYQIKVESHIENDMVKVEVDTPEKAIAYITEQLKQQYKEKDMEILSIVLS